jgi:beta-lactamase class A
VFAKNLTTGETIAIDADQPFPTASIIKLAVLAGAFQQIADGKLSPDARVRLNEADKVGIGDSGTLNELHDGTELTLADLLHLMIVVSDNTATNLVVQRVGTANVNALMVRYGLKQTKIFRPTFRDGKPDCCAELEKEFGLGMTTPREIATLMERIATGQAVNARASKQMLDILSRQQDRNMIARRIPFDAPNVLVASKSGTDEEKVADASGVRGHVRGDVAFVQTPAAKYVLAVLTRRVKDDSWTADNAGVVAGAEISKAVWDRWARQ